MDWTPYLPYLYSYFAVGIYLTSTMVYLAVADDKEVLDSYVKFLVSIVLHVFFWPVTINLVVRDAFDC